MSATLNPYLGVGVGSGSGDGPSLDEQLGRRLSRFRQMASGNGVDLRIHTATRPGAQSAAHLQQIERSRAFVRSVVMGASIAASAFMVGAGAYSLATGGETVDDAKAPMTTQAVQGTPSISTETISSPSMVSPPSSGSSTSSPSINTAPSAAATAKKSSGTENTKSTTPITSVTSTTSGLKSQLNYVNITFAGEKTTTLDAGSRIRLAKAAARQAGLAEVGLNWRDLYGIIHAETSWIARSGMGKNGVTSYGLAQFEPGTARALSLKDPNDPVQAVFASAKLIKAAALWTHERLEPLKLNAKSAREALMEGVSVYYNLGWKRRHAWKPATEQKLPEPTIAHIQNVQNGALIADQIEKELSKNGLVLTGSPDVKAATSARTSLEGGRSLKVIEAEVLRAQALKQSARQIARQSATQAHRLIHGTLKMGAGSALAPAAGGKHGAKPQNR